MGHHASTVGRHMGVLGSRAGRIGLEGMSVAMGGSAAAVLHSCMLMLTCPSALSGCANLLRATDWNQLCTACVVALPV